MALFSLEKGAALLKELDLAAGAGAGAGEVVTKIAQLHRVAEGAGLQPLAMAGEDGAISVFLSSETLFVQVDIEMASGAPRVVTLMYTPEFGEECGNDEVNQSLLALVADGNFAAFEAGLRAQVRRWREHQRHSSAVNTHEVDAAVHAALKEHVGSSSGASSTSSSSIPPGRVIRDAHGPGIECVQLSQPLVLERLHEGLSRELAAVANVSKEGCLSVRHSVHLAWHTVDEQLRACVEIRPPLVCSTSDAAELRTLADLASGAAPGSSGSLFEELLTGAVSTIAGADGTKELETVVSVVEQGGATRQRIVVVDETQPQRTRRPIARVLLPAGPVEASAAASAMASIAERVRSIVAFQGLLSSASQTSDAHFGMVAPLEGIAPTLVGVHAWPNVVSKSMRLSITTYPTLEDALLLLISFGGDGKLESVPAVSVRYSRRCGALASHAALDAPDPAPGSVFEELWSAGEAVEWCGDAGATAVLRSCASLPLLVHFLLRALVANRTGRGADTGAAPASKRARVDG